MIPSLSYMTSHVKLVSPVSLLRQQLFDATCVVMPESSKETSIRNIRPFGLRMQPELKSRLQKVAETRGMSLNELITSTMEMIFDGDESTHPAIVALPGYLVHALHLTSDYDSGGVEQSILRILSAAFPDPEGIEALHSKQMRVLRELEDLDRHSGMSGQVNSAYTAVFDLLSDINNELGRQALKNVKGSLPPSDSPSPDD